MSSTKSSVYRSGMSSAGETRSVRSVGTSRTNLSSSGGSSSVRARPAARPRMARTAPANMGGRERLQLIRNALSRLGYVCERQHHTAALDVTGEEDVAAYFARLRPAVETLARDPLELDTAERKDDGPRALAVMAAEVSRLLALTRETQEAVAAAEAAGDADGSVVYSGLQSSFLQEAARELEELETLLGPGAAQLPSRINIDFLQDLVSYHIKEFDAFANLHLRHFIDENRQEGNAFTAEVKDSFSADASVIGYCGFELTDVAVGVRPTESAHMVLEHAKQRFERLQNRILSADAAVPAQSDPSIVVFADVERHKRMLGVMRERVQAGLRELHGLREEWTRTEDEALREAAAGRSTLDTVLQRKLIRERQVVERARAVHDDVVHACLPFTGPQYHRRYGETYAQPCHIRLALRFGSVEKNDAVHRSTNGSNTVLLHTFMPEFRAIMRQHKIPQEAHVDYAALVPSRHQLWINFGDIPEMVKGERCALREVDPRADHFRALEEQKEVGGYFIIRGGERILRALLMQRSNVPLNVERQQYAKEGANFSPRAVVIRCKRLSGITTMNFLYYSFPGKVVLSFSRGEKWHFPLPLLLFALNPGNIAPAQLYRLLTAGMPESGSHRARVEALLQHHQQAPYGALTNHLDYILVIGAMMREYCQQNARFKLLPQLVAGEQQCQHDAWFGLYVLRHHILPHLNSTAATPDLPADATAEDVAGWLTPELRAELEGKFDALLAMARQLYLFVDGKNGNQGNDVLAYQEVFTTGQVLMSTFKSGVTISLKQLAQGVGSRLSGTTFRAIMQLALPDVPAASAADTLQKAEAYYNQAAPNYRDAGILMRLLSTGALNISDDRERDYYSPQLTGWVVMADHLNYYRFFEILRCVHRGKTIADMRSSDVRRFRCEAYGFICMVHSPDGTDCGVVNFLSVSAVMSSTLAADAEQLQRVREWAAAELPHLRRPAHGSAAAGSSAEDCLVGTVPVWIEGQLVGYVTPAEATAAAHRMRLRKALVDGALLDLNGLARRADLSELNMLEVVLVPPRHNDPAGLYVFHGSGRLMRPIQKIESAEVRAIQEVPPNAAGVLPFPVTYVGSWEQSWLDVAGVPSEMRDAAVQLGRKYEFMEQSGSNLISFTSCTIPFFEYNCSPRNLFQCGLSKQSAGTQMQSAAWRREAKLFRMYGPQRYISRTLPMDYMDLDDVNLGVNAVVAILAYTGYDMDDAVVLNRTAASRGMLNAGITIAKVVTAAEKGSAEKGEAYVFQNMLQSGSRREAELQPNGLPYKRTPASCDRFSFTNDHSGPSLRGATPVYCIAKRVERTDPVTGQRAYEYSNHKVAKWSDFDKGEDGWVHHVVPLAFDGPDPSSVLFVFRIPRPPTVGDKFSSRHGQKGTLPLHINAVDLPFTTRDGITPDVIINPHAFPSRMTVGMVLEMMSAKIGALEGRFMDDSAWRICDERPRAAAELGEALLRNGFNRYGREKLVDGISGEEMEADVFIGVSGYQRLRHMVSDKWQARARTDNRRHKAVTKTGQPVKGRKKHGGVRVGEMERDALLSYGVSEVVTDRLLHVSDKTRAFVCPRCGGLLSICEMRASEHSTAKMCRVCGAGYKEGTDCIAFVEIPQVFRLWASELTGIGIRVAFKVS